MSGDTRSRLVDVARQHFASKGFHGASISQIAAELDISKQALLYHFKRKEDLYAEVLMQTSDRLMGFVREFEGEDETPQEKFEIIVVSLYLASLRNPDDTKLLVREMMDHRSHVDQESGWYLDPFLDGLVSIIWRDPAKQDRPDAELFAFVYQVLGAIEYFILSRSMLARMYGEDAINEVAETYPAELQNMVRRYFA